MTIYLNKNTLLLQSFPVPTGSEWIEMEEPQPTAYHFAKVVDGVGVWVEPTEHLTETRERVRVVMNPLRDTFLNRLAGIALFSEEPETVLECKNLRVALLDITKDQGFLDAQTYEGMESALMTRYRIIASGASETIRNVFRELEI